MKKKTRLIIFLLVLATLVVAAWQLPVEQLMAGLQAWVDQNRQWATLVVTAVVTVGILVMLPASLLMMLCGFLFGIVKGFLVVWAATFFASTAAFLIARKLARPFVARRLASKPAFMAIDRAIRRKGFFVVLLTRLILVLPFPALNYSHGLTDVRLRDFVLGTMLGMVPPILLFVFLGTLASGLADIASGRLALEGSQLTVAIAGAAGVLLLAALIVFAARRALKEELARAAKATPPVQSGVRVDSDPSLGA